MPDDDLPHEEPVEAEAVTETETTPEVAAAPVTAVEARPSRWARFGGRDLLELFVLTGFALAQPLLSETGNAPELFTYRRINSTSMVWFVLLVTFAPTIGLYVVERLVALVSRTAERWLHLAIVAALAGIILIEVGKGKSGLPQGYALAVIAGILGVALTVLLVRSATLRLYLRYASPAPIVFALLFVATSPSGAIVRDAVGGSPKTTLATSTTAASTAPGATSTTGTTGTSGATTPPAGQTSSTGSAVSSTTIPGTAAHPPIVMIFFDEFPLKTLLRSDGTVNSALYPNFAWLSKNTTWFRNATGVSGFTPYAVPAMLRGEYPAKALPPVYASYPDNILAELSKTYNVSAAETITALCPSTVCTTNQQAKAPQATGLGPTLKDSGSALGKIVSPFKDKSDPTTEFADSGSTAFTASDTTTTSTGSGTSTTAADQAAAKCTSTECLFSNLGADQPSRVKRFVNSLVPTAKTAKPSFNFLHVLLPHGPWHYDDTGRPYPYPAVGPGHANSGGWLNQPFPVQVNLAREMLQLSYADKLLGDVLTKLRAENLLNKSLLIVTADHGEGFVPGEQARTMDAATAADLSWVPLFIKPPGQTTGKLDERNWSHVDLVPTIASIVNVKLPQTLPGVSGFGPPRTTVDKEWFNTPGKELLIPNPVATYKNDVVKGFGGILGNAKSPADLYKLGPRPDLVGKSVSGLTVAGESSLTVSLNGSVKSQAANVTATSPIPTLIWGHLNGKVGGAVAIAINGVIGAVVPTYADNGAPLSVEALVPPKLWHSGANDITLYMVGGSGATTQLHHVHPA